MEMEAGVDQHHHITNVRDHGLRCDMELEAKFSMVSYLHVGIRLSMLGSVKVLAS